MRLTNFFAAKIGSSKRAQVLARSWMVNVMKCNMLREGIQEMGE
ncbi:MAG: hypothetical protein PHW87_07865 [Methanothrix sp.]|nr:hypothetical protein [Methanothrix sp.]